MSPLHGAPRGPGVSVAAHSLPASVDARCLPVEAVVSRHHRVHVQTWQETRISVEEPKATPSPARQPFPLPSLPEFTRARITASQHGTAEAVPAVTCLEDQQVQRVVSQVGGSSDLVRGNPHQQLLVISPGQQQAASRQTQDTVLIDAGLQRQHLQLLLTNTPQITDPPSLIPNSGARI